MRATVSDAHPASTGSMRATVSDARWVSVRDGGRIEPVDAKCWVSVRDGGPH